MSAELRGLLREVKETPAYRRSESRTYVEQFATEAIAPMVEWLANADLQGFARLVLEGVARRGHKAEVLAALRDAYPSFGGDADLLTRLGKRIAVLDNIVALPPQVAVWVGVINKTRGARREPYLSEVEIANLRDDWQTVSNNPNGYRNRCWNCQAPVLEGQHPWCECRWLRCYCGACISPRHGYCRVGAERFPDAVWGSA